MTELHIDSKSHKFDRRNVLKAAASLPIAAIPTVAIAGEDPSLRLWAEYEAQELIEGKAIESMDLATYKLPPDHIKIMGTKIYRPDQIGEGHWMPGHIRVKKINEYHQSLKDTLAQRAKAERDLDIEGLTKAADDERKKSEALFTRYLDTDPTTPEGLARKVEELFYLGERWKCDERQKDLIKRLPSLVRGMV